MRKLLLLVLLCLPAHAATYYVCAATGAPCNASDANAGTSKTATWLHAPGMPAATGLAASTTINPGDSIIFRGGDTWHFNSGTPSIGGAWNWTMSGTTTNCQLNPSAGTVLTTTCIYIGVDVTWFSGASFTRPILSQDNPIVTSRPASCSFDATSFNAVNLGSVNYVIFDNFEMSGACWTGSSSDEWVTASGTQVEVSNLYFHGSTMSTAGGADDTYAFLGGSMPKANFIRCDHNVFDNSDGSLGTTAGQATGFSIRNTCKEISFNVFSHVSNGCICNPASVHDNLLQFLYEPVTAQHGNIFETNTAQSVTGPVYFYNNVMHNTNEGVGIWLETVNENIYYFNNVSWHYRETVAGANGTDGANCFMYDQGASTVHSYFFGNTIDFPCNFRTLNGAAPTITFQNDHYIGYSPAVLSSTYSFPTGTVVDNDNHVFQTEAVANGQGYVTGNNYGPTLISNATVGAGGSLASFCSGLSDSVAGTACAKGIAGVSYNSSSHTVATNSTSARTNWDTGAYQFAQFTVTLTVVGLGVSVSDSLGGIVNCTSLTSPCAGTYSSGSDTLTATATSQHQLLSWGGACASQYPTCTLAVTSNLSVTANAGGCGPPTYPCTSVSTAAVGNLIPAFSATRPFNSTTFFTPLNPNADCLTRFIDQNIVQYGTNASGTVNTSGTSVTFVSGNNFVNTWGNSNITINGVVYQVASSPTPTPTALTLTTSAGTQTGVAYTFAGVSLATTIGAGNLTTGGGDTNQMSSINAAYLAIVANGVNWIFQTNTQGSCIQNNTNGGENPSVGVVGPFGFSRLTDTVFYYLTANHILNQGTVNSSAIPMTFTVTNNANFPFDFDNCPAAGTGAGSSSSFLGIASNDSTFGLGIVWGGGGQGTGHLLFVYTLGVGCATLDVSPAGTSTTAANWYAFCSGNCSPTGTNVPPSGTSTVCFDPNAATGSGIHDAQLSLSGNVLEAAGGCFSPLGVGNVVMWQAGTSNILGLGQSGSTWDGQVHYSGHNTFGFASALITNNPFPNNRIVDPLNTTNLGGYFNITPLPSSIGAGTTDYHGDWPEPLGQPHDINYWIVGSHNTSTPTTPLYLENMVFGLSPTAGTLPIPVFGPEFATGSSPYFGCGNSILYASQNAKWAVFITDDLNNLGTDANGNPLCSVYVYALDGPAAPPHPPCVSCFLADNSQPAKVESVVKGDRP